MNIRQTVRHWYDKHYATFGPGPLMPWGRRILHHFMALQVPPEAHVIDLGCGDGALLAALRTVAGHQPRSLWGIEQSQIAARQAEARCPGSNIIIGDLLALPFAMAYTGMYRVAILAEVIEHLNDPVAALAAVRTLLAPGGIVILSFPNYFHLPWLAIRLLAEHAGKPSWVNLQPIDRLTTVGSVLLHARRCGLRLESASGTVYFPPLLERIEPDVADRLLDRFHGWPFAFHPVLVLRAEG